MAKYGQRSPQRGSIKSLRTPSWPAMSVRWRRTSRPAARSVASYSSRDGRTRNRRRMTRRPSRTLRMIMNQSRNTPAALPELLQQVRRSPCRARRLASCALVLLASFLCAGALADADDAEQLLKQADAAKLADYAKFSQL